MLKIKDNIDLKELEKFGFVEMPDGIFMEQEGLVIYKDDMNVLCFAHAKRSTHTGCLEFPCVLLDHTGWFEFPCVIFDLIKADMVEKVVEE